MRSTNIKSPQHYFGLSDVGLISKKIAVGILVYLIPVALLAGGLFVIQLLLK